MDSCAQPATSPITRHLPSRHHSRCSPPQTKRKRQAPPNRALCLSGFSPVDRGFLHYGCAGGFAFAASILLFNSVCCSGVSTSFSLAIVALWSSFIFAFFCSSLSEVSLDTA